MRVLQSTLCLSTALAAMGGTATAQSFQPELEVSAGLDVSDNPVLSSLDDTGAIRGELRVRPSLVRETARSTIQLNGTISHREYSRLYSSETLGSAELQTASQLSERLSITGSARYSQQLAVDAFDEVTAAIDPRSVRITKAANLGGSLILSERSSLMANASVSQNRFRRSEVLQGYDTVGVGLGYMRALSERMSVGVNSQVSFQDYSMAGSSRVTSLYGMVTYRLDQLTTLEGGIGGEWVSVNEPMLEQGAGSSDRLLLGGNARLCRERLRMNLCINADVGSDATGFGRLQRQASIGVSYDYRYSERTMFTAGADYNRASNLVGDELDPVFGPSSSISFFSARGGVERRINRSLTLAGFGSYRQRSGIVNADAFLVGGELRWSLGRNNGRN